jgi:hypothetical protein
LKVSTEASPAKTTETELTGSQLLQAAFDSTETVRFIVNAEGVVLHFNRKAYENSILMHGRELRKGDSLLDFAGDTVNKVQNHLRLQLQRAFTGETFVIENEVNYKAQSKWFQTEYVPIVHGRRIIAVSIATFDITGRKRAEIAAAELIAELKTSGQHRLQQVEYTLEALVARDADLLSQCQPVSADVSSRIDRLQKDLLSLRNKVNSWRQQF